MSEPPEYQKLLNKDTESFDVDVEDQAPTYPPGPSDFVSRVIFVYAPPRFGFDDPKEYVGLVGKTKEKTIQNICRYIPELAEYPADHISFRLSSTASAHPRNWPVVTEDIWFTFVSDPPEKLGVIVEPTQKDKDANRARQVKISIIIVCCFIGFWGLVAAIVAMGDHFFPS
ncbi:hypothetical protein CNH00040 [Cryptococcus deneoformans JEC21]|uniref:Uncharacterized protein n=1 Tax=Cryptococcus deneoformans (strain JEC21 / ATCC MYA-565) TaxID=214684 RepID=Q5KC76_CRYD1|nr:hypothetical protein CNH00040 [Cryptococcus neoformans var. neoformans JEC21]AAW44891.2 hypothetical protein CNH00040 [Cryptococcus neoformans var. neoformans JEC21]